MTDRQKRACKCILELYGLDVQIDVAAEELSGIIGELAKCKQFAGRKKVLDDARKYIDGIINKIADVKIILEQIEIGFNISNAVSEKINYKLQQHLSMWKYETIVEAWFNNTEDSIGEKLRQRKKLELGAKKVEVSQ